MPENAKIGYILGSYDVMRCSPSMVDVGVQDAASGGFPLLIRLKSFLS